MRTFRWENIPEWNIGEMYVDGVQQQRGKESNVTRNKRKKKEITIKCKKAQTGLINLHSHYISQE